MKNRKKKTLVSLVLGFIVLMISVGVKAEENPSPGAASAVLMDFTTGKILYQKNAYVHRAPASTTKILTALVALEHGELNQTITASQKASKTAGSSIWLAPGEEHRLEELVYGILLSSGNDASVAVAEGLAGSELKFTEWMNQKAQEIGAKESHFKNSNGLPEVGHYSTAYDLALITRYALNNEKFAEIVRTKRKVIDWPGRDYDRAMVNHNKLLWRYQFADGVKTGYTREAGKCLVASATKNGQRLIVVVLNSKRMYEDSQELLEYGFNNYQLLTVVSPEAKVGTVAVAEGVQEQVPVLPNRPITLVLPKGAENNLQVNLELPKVITAPVEKMQQVGEIEVKLGEKVIEKVPVVTAAPVPKESIWAKIWGWFRRMLS